MSVRPWCRPSLLFYGTHTKSVYEQRAHTNDRTTHFSSTIFPVTNKSKQIFRMKWVLSATNRQGICKFEEKLYLHENTKRAFKKLIIRRNHPERVSKKINNVTQHKHIFTFLLNTRNCLLVLIVFGGRRRSLSRTLLGSGQYYPLEHTHFSKRAWFKDNSWNGVV